MAAFLGVLLSGATVVTINPSRGDERTRADIAALELPLIAGSDEDLALLVTNTTDSATVSLSDLFDHPGEPGDHTTRGAGADVAVRMLTSGTTGPPKRVDLSYDMLARSVMGPAPDRDPAPTEPRRGVAIVNSALVHIGGVYRVLQCIAQARPFVLLDRFELNAWAAAVRKHRPRTVSLVPAALRTVLHSDLTRADLASVRTVTCGTAPWPRRCRCVHREVRHSRANFLCGNRVRQRRGRLTLADHSRYWHTKRGSVGRANPGTQLRIVDTDGAPVERASLGLLEVKPAQLRFGPVGAYHRCRPNRRGWLCLDCRASRSGDHSWRFQGAARRCASGVGEPSGGGSCRGSGPIRPAPRSNSGLPWSNCAVPPTSAVPSWWSICERGCPATRSQPRFRSSPKFREQRRQA